MRSGLYCIIMITAIVASAHAYDWNTNPGTGDPNNPYQISEPNHLIAIGSNPELLDKHFILMNDIVFDPNNNPAHVFTKSLIGEMDSVERPFEGTFSGNNKTIQNLRITSQNIGRVGLFSCIAQSGTVQELHLKNINIKFSYEYGVGGLAGRNEGVLKSCSVCGIIDIVAGFAGGLVGENIGNIEMCHTNISIRGDNISHAGGLIGWNAGSVSKSYSQGTIIKDYESYYVDNLGGLIGHNEGHVFKSFSSVDILGAQIYGGGGFVGTNRGTITACYSTGDIIEAYVFVGGFVGTIEETGTLSACYSTGSVQMADGADQYIGGFCGDNCGTTHSCYWDIIPSGMSHSFGGTGKTTTEMKTGSTFVDWGYDDVWVIDDGNDYPRLDWENTPGIPIQDSPRSYGGGDGTPENPFVISMPEHLQTIGLYRQDFDKHYILANDIELLIPVDLNLESSNFHVIGNLANPFTGTFDGQYHTISGLYHTRSNQNSFVGLFGCVASVGEDSGLISHVMLGSPNFTGTQTVGGVCGKLIDGRIYRCGVGSGTIAGLTCAGGIVGQNLNGYITQSFAEVDVTCDAQFPTYGTGGLVGYNKEGKIESCYAKGTISALYGGGLVGKNSSGGILTSFAVVVPSAGNNEFGGLSLSDDKNGSSFLSYWDKVTSGIPSSSEGEGRTTDELMSRQTFIGWGDDIWNLNDEMDYPHLSWENTAGQPLIDAPRTYGGGSGSLSDPYQIWDANQLNTIGHYQDDFNKHFRLMSDISFPGHEDIDKNFRSIGTKCAPFTGTFDGNDKTLEGLYYDGRDSYMGLFGYIKADNSSLESVTDLRLYDVNIESSGNYVGLLGGGIENGYLKNCVTESFSYQGVVYGGVRGHDNVGGLVGYAEKSIIDGCISICGVEGNESVGGLVGWIYSGEIKNSKTSGRLYGQNMAGGFIGRGGPGGAEAGLYWFGDDPENDIVGIQKCASHIDINGHSSIGGFCGSYTWGKIEQSFCVLASSLTDILEFGGFAAFVSKAKINNCYTHCHYEEDGNYFSKGAFIGNSVDTTLNNCYSVELSKQLPFVDYDRGVSSMSCYYLGETNGDSGMRLDEQSMMTSSSFVDWDFVGDLNGENDIWRMCADGVDYPRLSWEFARNGDFACGDGVDFDDLAALAEHWLLVGTAHPTVFNYACDGNGDGVIDLGDFGVLAENWE